MEVTQQVSETQVQIVEKVRVLVPTCLLCEQHIEHEQVRAAARGWRPGVQAVAWKTGFAHLSCASQAWRHAGVGSL